MGRLEVEVEEIIRQIEDKIIHHLKEIVTLTSELIEIKRVV